MTTNPLQLQHDKCLAHVHAPIVITLLCGFNGIERVCVPNGINHLSYNDRSLSSFVDVKDLCYRRPKHNLGWVHQSITTCQATTTTRSSPSFLVTVDLVRKPGRSADVTTVCWDPKRDPKLLGPSRYRMNPQKNSRESPIVQLKVSISIA